MTKKSNTSFTDEEKLKIRLQVIKDTGMTLKRVEGYLQRFNWDLKALYEYPVVKSAVKKTKAEALKNKALEDIDTSIENVPDLLEKSSKKAKKTSTIKDKIGNVIDVMNDGTKMFRGKAIRNDSECLYAPYLTQKEIINWVKTHGKVSNPLYVVKLEELNKKIKTKYKYWDELSRKQTLTEGQLIEYEPFVNWYLYLTYHRDVKYSDKFMKKMKDHFTGFELGLYQ